MTAYRARLTEIDIRRLIKATDDDERAAEAPLTVPHGSEDPGA